MNVRLKISSLEEAFRIAMALDTEVELREGPAIIRDVRRIPKTNDYEIICQLLIPKTDPTVLFIGIAILALLSV